MSRVTMKYFITMCYACLLSFHLVLENTTTLKAAFIYTGVIDFFYDWSYDWNFLKFKKKKFSIILCTSQHWKITEYLITGILLITY